LASSAKLGTDIPVATLIVAEQRPARVGIHLTRLPPRRAAHSMPVNGSPRRPPSRWRSSADCQIRQALPRRWVVERFLAWINRSCRLAKDFVRSIPSANAFLYAACVMLLTRRLGHASAPFGGRTGGKQRRWADSQGQHVVSIKRVTFWMPPQPLQWVRSMSR
jgi:transposase